MNTDPKILSAVRAICLSVAGGVAERYAPAFKGLCVSSYHEAGHAIIGHLCGRDKHDIEIIVDPITWGGLVWFRSTGETDGEPTQAKMLEAMQTRCADPTNSDTWVCTHMMMLILNLNGLPDSNENVNYMISVAREVVRAGLYRNRALLEDLAREIETRLWLRPCDVKEFFAKSPPEGKIEIDTIMSALELLKAPVGCYVN